MPSPPVSTRTAISVHRRHSTEAAGSGRVRYIDRRNDVLKLSQAEFVAVGPLGATFESGSPAIKQIYVYGNSSRSYLLAVVVPDLDVVPIMLGNAPDEAELAP